MRRFRTVPLLASFVIGLGPATAQAPVPPAAPEAAPARSRAARPGPPRQPIQVYEARIAGGDLRLSGRVARAGTPVLLDDDISVISGRDGYFAFRLPYLPQNCIATLKAGEDEREAVVGDCGPAGPQGQRGEGGSQGPTGTMGAGGAPGPAGPTGPRGETGAAGPKGEAGERGPAGAPGTPGAPGVAGPVGPAPSLRAESCDGPACEVTCAEAETLVSAYCLAAGTPTYTRREGGEVRAACPGESTGTRAVCGRL